MSIEIIPEVLPPLCEKCGAAAMLARARATPTEMGLALIEGHRQDMANAAERHAAQLVALREEHAMELATLRAELSPAETEIDADAADEPVSTMDSAFEKPTPKRKR